MRKVVSAMPYFALAVASPALAGVPIPTLAGKNAAAELDEGRQIELDAWVKYAGELLLFDSANAIKLRLVYPYCISAKLAHNVGRAKAAQLAGKRVRVRGTLLRYNPVPDEPNTISTSTMIDGTFFKNWCFGPYVLRIERLTIVH